MEATSENMEQLRKMLHERISEGETEDDTRFLDEDLEELLIGADNIYWAASEGWMMKAGMYKEEMAEFHEVEAGTESYRLTRLQERLEYAKTLSQYYERRAEKGGARHSVPNAVFLTVDRPEV